MGDGDGLILGPSFNGSSYTPDYYRNIEEAFHCDFAWKFVESIRVLPDDWNKKTQFTTLLRPIYNKFPREINGDGKWMKFEAQTNVGCKDCIFQLSYRYNPHQGQGEVAFPSQIKLSNCFHCGYIQKEDIIKVFRKLRWDIMSKYYGGGFTRNRFLSTGSTSGSGRKPCRKSSSTSLNSTPSSSSPSWRSSSSASSSPSKDSSWNLSRVDSSSSILSRSSSSSNNTTPTRTSKMRNNDASKFTLGDYITNPDWRRREPSSFSSLRKISSTLSSSSSYSRFRPKQPPNDKLVTRWVLLVGNPFKRGEKLVNISHYTKSFISLKPPRPMYKPVITKSEPKPQPTMTVLDKKINFQPLTSTYVTVNQNSKTTKNENNRSIFDVQDKTDSELSTQNDVIDCSRINSELNNLIDSFEEPQTETISTKLTDLNNLSLDALDVNKNSEENDSSSNIRVNENENITQLIVVTPSEDDMKDDRKEIKKLNTEALEEEEEEPRDEGSLSAIMTIIGDLLNSTTDYIYPLGLYFLIIILAVLQHFYFNLNIY